MMVALVTAQVKADPLRDPINNALKGDRGQLKFDLRWRYENVDQQGRGVASGDPVRLRLGYLTPKRYNLQSFVEFEGNAPVFEDQSNSIRNGKTQFPVIADPEVAELNQGWISYAGFRNTLLKVGRQRIVYDNTRWIGDVAWRQLEQTFDSVSIVNKTVRNVEFQAAYIWNVKNILSQDISMSSPVFNLAYTFPRIGQFTLYGYLLDFSGASTSRTKLSSQSYGFRFKGKPEILDNLNVLYQTEYAFQRDYQNNTNRYSTHYFYLTGGFEVPYAIWKLTNFTGEFGWEYLGSQNNIALQTPLGTNHAFNGWADQFLTTPPQGLKDLYGSLSTNIFGVRLVTVYHQFNSTLGGIDYGHEIDALVVKKFAKHYTLLFKYANYFANDFATDTQKFWISVGLSF